MLLLGSVLVAALALSAGAARRRPTLASGLSGIVGLAPSGRGVATVGVLAGTPAAACAGAGSVWVADATGGTVSQIDPATGGSVDRVRVGGEPASLACGDGAVWVANALGASVVRLDPTTDTVTDTIRFAGANPDAVALAAGRLWVADSSTRALYELDPATGARLRTIPLDVQPSAIAVAAGALWVAGYDSAVVLKIDAASARILGEVHVGNGPSSIVVAAGDLWVANRLDSTVTRIDPARLVVRASIPVGSGPAALAAADGSLWVADQYAGSVARIDPRRNAVVAVVPVGGIPTALALDRDRLWIAVAPSVGSHRGGTLVIATARAIASVDPAFYSVSEPPQFDGLAYDTLVTFERDSGVAGLRLVPDLALALPTPGDGGLTYTFRLRPGIRYWSGVPLRASDFRRAIERLFRAGSPGNGYFAAIVGAPACARRPAVCDLSRGIVTNDVARTVVFHLTAPDPEFLDQLTEQDYAAPVPPGTSDHDTALHPFPGTGPYRIARADQTGVYFTRNPFFREWSHAAQPAGNPDTIPSSLYRQTAIQSPAQLHSSPLFAVEFVPLNTRRAPFDNVLARRAVNFAIDRNAIARMYGGPAFATPTCQPLAPGLPAYRRYCPYTRDTDTEGGYSGPELGQARRLVAASGTRGEHVVVLGSPDEGVIPPGVTAYIGAVMRSLGYHVTVREAPFASISRATNQGAQLSTNGDWLADYPDPSSYLPAFFSCGGGHNDYLCHPALDREMHRAGLLELRTPAQANTLWTRIDRTLTDQADWVPTVNEREVDLVSKRLGNYEFNPVWGFLADQAWIH